MKRWTVLITIIALIVIMTSWAGRQVLAKENPLTLDYEPWPEEVIDNIAALPVHNGDRIKPLSTYAKVMMVKFHGSRRIKFQTPDGETVKIGPEAFMLDALFRPNYSTQHPIFKVTNAEILTAVGMETKKASDYYSYESLSAHREELYEKASSYEEMAQGDAELSIIQSMTLDLARNVREYETLLTYLNFARSGIVLPRLPDAPQDAKLKYVPTSSFMMTMGEIQRIIAEVNNGEGQLPTHLIPVLDQLRNHMNDAKYGPILFAPNAEDLQWTTAGEALMGVFRGFDPEPMKTIAGIKQLETLYDASREEGTSTFSAELQKTVTLMQAVLDDKQKADFTREVNYNKASWFFLATFLCFLPAMIFIALSWLAPTSKFGGVMSLITWGFSALGLGLTIAGITQRALIMHRPPVGNLYDTIIFIAAGVVFIALFTELMTRRKLALGVAPFIGFFLLVLAHLYEVESKADNMEPLIAVLRSNFWLTVHVPVITFGYAAGLAAWLFGVVYVFVRAFGLHKEDPSIRKLLTRMTYGSVCFCLLLSLIGTVTGGIWANDSWGRFWGWDPKENGALMIVLWSLFILHARAGGIIKEWGLQISAIITGPIVVFSWWHTNLLGVGLHSYGFSDSKADAVYMYYAFNVAFLLIGLITAALQTKRKA